MEKSGQSLLRVSLCSNSDTLLRQVQTLLLRFGITGSRFTDAARGTSRLCIVGHDNLHAFAGKIGFVSDVKRQALFDVLVANSDRAISKKDYIPFLAAYVRQRAVRHREWLAKNNFDRPARLAEAMPRLTAALQDAADWQMLAFFAKTNYLYDPVVAIDDAGVQNVYSIRVDSDCHSFVANGFINHNTEARMSPFATEMLQDLDRETVDWTENYDQTRLEPTVLPGKFPNFLCNGGSGIAVGMATNVPPHNLREVVDGAIHLLDNPDATSEDLMEFIKGPDFPTAGLILGTKGIRQAYATGRGSVIMQARTTIEPIEGGKNQIIITELPYQVIKARLIEQIAELVKQKKIEGIADLNDYTDRTGMRVVVTLKREAYPKKVLNFLLKHTPMRSTFGVNMLALVDGQPRLLRLPQALTYFLDHRREVITRRTLFDLNRAKARAHILEGLQIALDFLDEIIALIRAARTPDVARDADDGAVHAVPAAGRRHPRHAAPRPDRPGAREAGKRLQGAAQGDRPARRHSVQPGARGPDHQGRTAVPAGQVRRRAPHPHRADGGRGDRRRGPHPRRGDDRLHHPRRLHQARPQGDLPDAAPGRQGAHRGEHQGRGHHRAPLRRHDPPLHPVLHRPGPRVPPEGL